MKQQRDFPIELLQASNKERVEYFKSVKIKHDSLDVAFKKSMAALGSSSGPQLITITGPTGVGKTTLAKQIYAKLVMSHKDEVVADPSMVPVIGISAVPPNGTNFNWKDFYYRLLEKNGDVLLDHKLNVPKQANMFPELLFQAPSEGATADALRRSLEKCIKERKTRFLIIDEAHHLLMVKDYDRLEYQFETLKSLSNEGNTTIILVGTYRLMDIRDHSGQLVRRSEIVHFPRYDFRSDKDRSSFASSLATLEKKLPLEELSHLVKDVEYFYMKTAGCIGILKDWLTRCLDQAILEGRKSIDAKFASSYALDNKGLRTIIEEALAGEAKLEDESMDSIETLLKNGFLPKEESKDDTSNPTKKKGPVGKRKPVRDKVGQSHVAP